MDGAPEPALALAAAAGDPRAGDGYTPDAALVNYYDRDARLGLHQDKDERDDAPVVSLSVGDSCTFRFGNTRDRGRPYQDVLLTSGDLFFASAAPRGSPSMGSPRSTPAPPLRAAA